MVFLDERKGAGREIDRMEVVEFRIAAVDADKNTIADCSADPGDLCCHTVEGCEIPCRLVSQVDGVDVEVLIAVLVLQIDEVAAIVGPLENSYAAFAIVCDRLRVT